MAVDITANAGHNAGFCASVELSHHPSSGVYSAPQVGIGRAAACRAIICYANYQFQRRARASALVNHFSRQYRECVRPLFSDIALNCFFFARTAPTTNHRGRLNRAARKHRSTGGLPDELAACLTGSSKRGRGAKGGGRAKPAKFATISKKQIHSDSWIAGSRGLDRRIGSFELIAETAAWEQQRNAAKALIKWMFTTEKAKGPSLPAASARLRSGSKSQNHCAAVPILGALVSGDGAQRAYQAAPARLGVEAEGIAVANGVISARAGKRPKTHSRPMRPPPVGARPESIDESSVKDI
jgi:hypothetical protein